MNRMKRLLTLLLLTCGLTTGLWASSIPGALSGRFTINASGEKVVFSQGNLQYVGTWQFAENQWDCFSTSQYNDHRDLFGWGTGDAPNKVSDNNGDYGTFTDWGTNAITNGGNTENSGWRTLTKDEWVYLFYSRENAATLFGFGSVAGVNGLIILPDNWITPEGASFTASTTLDLVDLGSYYHNGNNDNYSHNTYTAEQWAVMESAGAVFLPAAAYRHGGDSNIHYTDFGGFYWSSTPYDSDKAYYLNFYYNDLDPQFKEMRYGGRPVRLVKASLDQDNEGYYLLGSAQDWQDFAALVQTTPTANARMTADIDLGDDQTHIGYSSSSRYCGVFDGDGHTLTVNYNSSEYGLAPFRYTAGATIKNLHIDGSIISTYSPESHTSGVISHSRGADFISNVWVSVDIQSGGSGWIECAAFIGCNNSGNSTITDCLFTGSMKTTSGYYNGCFFGYSDSGNVTVSNCLSTGTFDYYGGSTYVESHGGVFSNCYVRQFPSSIPTAMQVTNDGLADGTTAYKLQNNRGDMVWGQRIGTDAMPVLTNDENYRVYRSKTGGYTNNPEEAYEGIQQDGEGNYLLGSLPDWQDFAEIVNSGTNPAANAKMTADIDLGDDQTKIGSFSGIFDGQGHTITINLSTTEQYVGLFCNITDATINNLHVTGAITTNTRFVGGMVGRVYGTSTIQNCWSSVNVTTTYSGDGVQGGMIGCVNGTLNISDCLYDGALTGSSAYTWGGFVGWLYGTTNISNCLFASDDISVGASYTATHVAGGGTVTNCYYKNVMGSAQGTQATTAELADGTTSTALQNGRAEEIWVQDPLTNQPMLALFAGKYTVPASGLGTFSAKAKFALPEGLEAYYCKNYDATEGAIGVTAIEGVVPAEIGVLLRGEPGETYTLTISDDTPATVTDNALVAVTTQTKIDQTSGDYTNFGLSNGTFKKVNSAGGTVKANRAYLHILTSELSGSLARGIKLVWNGDVTNIQEVQGSTFEVQGDNSWYTLSGLRLNGKPTTKGIYIVNGKKIFIN